MQVLSYKMNPILGGFVKIVLLKLYVLAVVFSSFTACTTDLVVPDQNDSSAQKDGFGLSK